MWACCAGSWVWSNTPMHALYDERSLLCKISPTQKASEEGGEEMIDWHGLGDCHRCGKSMVGAWFRGNCKCLPPPPEVFCAHPRNREILDKLMTQPPTPDQLQQIITADGETIKALLMERDSLTAENERFRKPHMPCELKYADSQSGHEFCCWYHQCESLTTQIAVLREALIWCSGSQDFSPEGKAREGWIKVCQTLLQNPSPATESLLEKVRAGEKCAEALNRALVEGHIAFEKIEQADGRWHDWRVDVRALIANAKSAGLLKEPR